MSELFNSKTLNAIRNAFPILNQNINEEKLIYFDNAATSQMPESVLETYIEHYRTDHANIHRGIHTLANRSTQSFENVRHQIAEYLNVTSSGISFNSGTTEGINHLAFGLMNTRFCQPGGQILLTPLEHHANLVPWQEVAMRTGQALKFIPVDLNSYLIDLETLYSLDPKQIRVLAIQHISNVTGVEQPIKQIAEWTQCHDILLVVDGAQAAPHQLLNLTELGIDAYTFSAHKMYGPTGLGVLYTNEKIRQELSPFMFGGEMIERVEYTQSTYKKGPLGYEAGTQAISEVIAFGTVFDLIDRINMKSISSHISALTKELVTGLKKYDFIELYYNPEHANGIISFNIKGVHPHDAATAYDALGIAVRAGHHCCQPLMRLLEVPATLRASLAIYNTPEEVARFIEATVEIKEFFA